MADRIDEIVGEKAFEQFDRLIDKLDISKNKFAENIRAALQLNTAIGGAKSFKEYAKNVEDTEKKLNQLRQSQINLEKAELQLQQKRDQITARQLANDQKRSKSLTDESRLYTQLSKTLEKLRADAQDVGVRFGENSVQFQKAGERVRVLDARLKSIDQQLGKSQRFVGEYERAGTRGFDRMGNSINQLTRELPAFTFSVQTGFLALSNNIPIFADEIKRVTEEVKTMRAEGKQVPGVFKQIASSFLSWMTLLSIGVTLITIYGKEIGNFFTAIFKGTDALKRFAENQKNLNDIYKQSNKDAGEQITKLKILRTSAQDVNQTDEQRLKAVKELQKEFPKTYKALSDEIILNGQDAKATDELTAAILRQSKARASLGKLSDIQGKILDAEFQKEKIRNAERSELSRVTGPISAGQGVGAPGTTMTEAQQRNNIKVRAQAAIDLEDQNLKILRQEESFLLKFAGLPSLTEAIIGKPEEDKKKKDTLLRDQLELSKARIEQAKEAAERIYTDEENSLSKRLSALDTYTKKSEELIRLDARIQLSEKDLTSAKIQAIELRAANDILNIQTDSRNKAFALRKADNERLLKIEEDRLKKELEAGKKAGTALINQISLLAEQRQQRLSESADNDLLNLAGQFSRGEITEQQYAKRRLEIQRKLTQDLVNEDIKRIQTLISLQKLAGNDTAENEKKLAELRQRLSKDTVDAQISDLEKLRDKEKELIDKRKEIAQEFGNFAIAIVQGQFQESEYRLQKESEQADIKKAKDIEEVERSIASEQDKAAKIAIINAKAQTQKEALERRQRQLDISRARFEKQAGIGRIIVDTASAVAEALPNIPLSILVGALGAAQLATAIATPLPRFEHGGEMKYTGLAEYGHGTELRIDPDGKMSFTSATPEVGVVKKGTEFISNKELMQIFARPDKTVYAGGQRIGWDEVMKSASKDADGIKSAILSLKQQRQRGVGYYNTTKGQAYFQRNN